jgi:hypothetical protein
MELSCPFRFIPGNAIQEAIDTMLANQESDGLSWGTGIWTARPLTEPEVEWILAALEQQTYTAYFWLPDPNSELDWQDGARFFFKVVERSTWSSFVEQISPTIRLEMFAWIETEPVFETNLSKHSTLFNRATLDKFVRFTQRFL